MGQDSDSYIVLKRFHKMAKVRPSMVKGAGRLSFLSVRRTHLYIIVRRTHPPIHEGFPQGLYVSNRTLHLMDLIVAKIISKWSKLDLKI